ncbi:hypothetical protein ACMFMF_006238 [Clarireedia jacksonii]
MKTVAIIGAGPAGLDQGKAVGGLWAVAANPAGIINAEMNTNLSQFTVCFSDLAWESVGLEPAANLFPKAWQVNRYLEQYARKFIPDGVLALQTYVKSVEQVLPGDGKSQWRVTHVKLKDGNSNSEKEEENVAIFDYLIVASGLFSKPQPPTFSLHNIASDSDNNRAPVLHSSQYRKLGDLSTTGIQPSTGKILLIGGSHSGAEVAATIALQMLDAEYSPTGSGIEPLEIIHVMPYPLVSLPNFVPAGDKPLPRFLPLDSLLYDLSSRSDDPISLMYAHTTPEKTRQLRDLLIKIMEGETSKKNDSDDEKSRAAASVSPYAAVGESYVEFVRSGAIRPVLGRVVNIEAQTKDDARHSPNLLQAMLSPGSAEIQIQDIAAVIYATGFEPTLDFLPEALKNAASYDVSCPRLPLLLNRNFSTSSDTTPENLAFMGFNYGSYWGVLENEARAIAQKWASDMNESENSLTSNTSIIPEADNENEKSSSKLYTFMQELRSLLRESPSSVPQNFFGDYPGLMEQASRELHLQRVDLSWGVREGMACPARYIDSGSDRVEAEKTMQKLQRVLDTAMNHHAFAARAAFRGLHGNWSVKQMENSNSETESTERASTALFHPRFPTDGISDLEYLVIMKAEDGNAVRSFVYRFSETTNSIGVWNARAKAADAQPIYELAFASATSDAKDCLSVVATTSEETRNSPNTIISVYTFWFAGVHVAKFTIEMRCPDGGSVDGELNLEFTR